MRICRILGSDSSAWGEKLESYLFKFKIKSDNDKAIRDWQKYAQEHRDEILQTLKNEGIQIEDVFLDKHDDDLFLYYYMRVKDLEHAQKVFKSSKLKVDIYQKEFLSLHLVATDCLEKLISLSTIP
jgi:L-rhamnose mutarotase